MHILAFDCAGAQCAAALVEDGRVVAQRQIEGERGHAQFLVPLLGETLADAGLSYSDIDRIAVTTGPGSFTGIRVALAAAHGLALALDKPIVGITVFEAVAAAANESEPQAPKILVAVDSRRAEIFAQLFDATVRPSGDPMMASPAEIAAAAGQGPLLLAGDAAGQVLQHLDPAAVTLHSGGVDPAIVARLAAGRTPGPPPAPFYMRPADARPRAR
jgi:tRNA threonylcarbamoyladenosine biosynthesis protein TsaB